MGLSIPKQRLQRVLLALAVTALVTALILIDRWVIAHWRRSASPAGTPTATTPDASTSPSLSTASPTPLPTGSVAVGASPTPAPAATAPPSLKLIIPVAGVRAEQLRDTYNDTRSEDRTHNALDIMAARGTPVLAAAEGKIVKLFSSDRGGITIYQLANDQKTILYYAHLDRYADGLTEGKQVAQGETIGYVGDTGNAGAGNYHLHFAVWLVSDPKRYWSGENINPYPLLRP